MVVPQGNQNRIQSNSHKVEAYNRAVTEKLRPGEEDYRTALIRSIASANLVKKASKALGQKVISKEAKKTVKLLGAIKAGEVTLSGRILEDLQRNMFSKDSYERMKFWRALGYSLHLAIGAGDTLSSNFKETAEYLSGILGVLEPIAVLAKSQKTEAGAKTAFASIKRMSVDAPVKEKIIVYTDLTKQVTNVIKVASLALGYSNVAIGLALLSAAVGVIKAFIKSEGFIPHQSEWKKEFAQIKSEAITLVEGQYREAINALKSRTDISKKDKEMYIASLTISMQAAKKAIVQAPDEQVLLRSLVYYEIGSRDLHAKKIFSELKAEEIDDLQVRTATLLEQKMALVEKKGIELEEQHESITQFMKQLDDGLKKVEKEYKENSPTKEFMEAEINSVKGMLKEEQLKIEALILEKIMRIDEPEDLPMFEGYLESNEDVTKRYNVIDWVERVDRINSPSRKSYLSGKVGLALEEPSVMDILHL